MIAEQFPSNTRGAIATFLVPVGNGPAVRIQSSFSLADGNILYVRVIYNTGAATIGAISSVETPSGEEISLDQIFMAKSVATNQIFKLGIFVDTEAQKIVCGYKPQTLTGWSTAVFDLSTNISSYNYTEVRTSSQGEMTAYFDDVYHITD